ncbi:MAG TPA: DNA internalization-related competence protein ComEC/Rec2 [Candidatus Baltobacteraceae bacterium]|nr:DNA internalization-related competence protein ComEC/Rec2 [Candidatus Baltobacteraceae bacterium]
MDRSPLLPLGAAAAAGAALGGPLDAAALYLVAAAAILLVARFRASAAAALAAGLAASWLAAGPGGVPIREHTTRVACTLVEAQVCRSDEGLTYEVSSFEALPAAGTRVLLRGRLAPIDGPRNPGEPDFAELARERGIDATIAQAHLLQVLPDGPASASSTIAKAHGWAAAQFQATLSEPYASVLEGELWGEKTALPPQLRSEFQETGTVHILVTAGLHLGVVALLVLAVLKRLRLPRPLVCAGGAIAVWVYVLFSGAHLPSVRAASMVSFGIAAYALGRATLSWNAYGAAMLLVAVLRPHSVTSASFALSFSCVGAILLLANPFERALESFAFPNVLKEALSVAAATQIGTWPLTAAVFCLFAPYALLANVLVVPVVGATMLLGAVQLLTAKMPLLAQSAAALNQELLAWIAGAVSTFAAMPHAAVPLHPPPLVIIALYDCAIVALVLTDDMRRRGYAAGIAALAVLWIALPPPVADGKLRVTVLDVGQADGIVIRTPRGHTILVDAGGRLERGAPGAQSAAEQIGEKIVVPFLRRSGVDSIDALILSHPHGDHAGGTPVVLRDVRVGEFADSGQRYGGYAYNDALQTARSERVPMAHPRAGDVWRLDDGITLTFIGPSLPLIQSNNTINDNSIAFILQYKSFRMLFTGDAGVAAEQRFLNEGIDLHAQVLKVGHHGSAYSSGAQFIAAVHPTYAIVSVGRHNLFGHPAPSTIETLRRFGASVYRTDTEGAATIATDGTSVSVTTMLP